MYIHSVITWRSKTEFNRDVEEAIKNANYLEASPIEGDYEDIGSKLLLSYQEVPTAQNKHIKLNFENIRKYFVALLITEGIVRFKKSSKQTL